MRIIQSEQQDVKLSTHIYFHNKSIKIENRTSIISSFYVDEAQPGGWKRKQINVVSKHQKFASMS